ncbi:hypothetical protein R6242_21670 [Iodobacter sp. CM08]|uniref:hypothetical protein n=1 Tax=Iodobacter sp. CM08 TaxID=3085902 RepID=UPI002981F71E|nr:hypothetical protein [Iodobacter sp. CM08]MDW5419186.1 hypothetical protein [Iodobacter sp. CM08]
MSTYNKEYYFILELNNKSMPILSPDEDTAEKPYTTQQLPLGTKPLIFENGRLDRQRAKNITPVSPPPNILFSGSNIVVKDNIREKLMLLDIENLAIQPSIYIDHKDHWHENYWFLTFTDRFDCWDRDKSTYDPDPLDQLGPPRYEIYTYSLNDDLLEKTPLKSRLIFKMGGTTEGNIVVHKSLAGLFNTSGAVLVPISDFGVTYP